jgi:hypothetical protein
MPIPEEAARTPQTPQPLVPRARRNAQGDIMEGLDPAAVAALEAEFSPVINGNNQRNQEASESGSATNRPHLAR